MRIKSWIIKRRTLWSIGLRFAESVQRHFPSALDVAVPDALLLGIRSWGRGSAESAVGFGWVPSPEDELGVALVSGFLEGAMRKKIPVNIRQDSGFDETYKLVKDLLGMLTFLAACLAGERGWMVDERTPGS